MKKYVKIFNKADVAKIKAIIKKNRRLAAKKIRKAKKHPLKGKAFYYDFK